MKIPVWKHGFNFLVAAGKVAGGATFIFGIFYGAYQYFEGQQERRVAESLARYREYNNTPLIAYREHIYKVLTDNQEQINAAAASEEQLEKAIAEMVKKGEIANQLILVL